MPDENKPPGPPDAPGDPNAEAPFKPDFTGEEEGKFGGEGKAERGVAVEGPKKEVGRGNRDPTPKPSDKPEGPVKRTKR